MNYRNIGKSDLKSSELGFGCMSLLKTAASEAEFLVNEAIALGINYFDTADLYDKGENEKSIGALLKPVRKNVLLASKVGNEWRKDGSGWDWNPTKKYILKAAEDSLQRLQTDYLDLYQLHGGTIEDEAEDTIEAFEILVQQGKIRYYGISSIRPNVIKRFTDLSDIKSVMMQYSLLDRRPEEAVIGLLESKNISVMARGVLGQGLLVNKPAKDYLGFTAREVSEVQHLISANCTEGVSSAACSLHYILGQKSVASLVIGFRTFSQLEEILQAYSQSVDKEILKLLAEELPAKKYSEHR